MKTIRINYMGSFLITAMLLLNSITGYSQDEKLTRREKKAVRKAEMEANFNILDSLLKTKRFVLVADFLQGEYGDRIPVVQSLNFIKVNVTTGVLQTGSNTGFGSNSVGGVTAEGSLGSMEITKNNKNMSYNVRFGLSTQIGHYDILMTVSSGNYATATITGLTHGRLTWEGHLETLENSRIFKGMNSI